MNSHVNHIFHNIKTILQTKIMTKTEILFWLFYLKQCINCSIFMKIFLTQTAYLLYIFQSCLQFFYSFRIISPALLCSSTYGTGQLRLLSYPIWHWWVCTNMTWDAPAHDIFGFKMTSRQRGAQQAGRPSVWKKRSSRRRTSLLSSLMISPFSPTPLKQLSTSRILLRRVALFLFDLHQFIYLFFTLSNPIRTPQHLQRCE